MRLWPETTGWRSRVALAAAARSRWSHHHLPAVGGERRACDQAGVVGGEEHHAARDLVRLAEAAQRDLRQDVLLQHLLRHRLDHLGGDVARADRVDGDAALRALLRQRLGKAELAGLGGGVVRLPHLSLLAVDRGDVDDATELAL